MKMVMAVIKPHKLDQVREALTGVGVDDHHTQSHAFDSHTGNVAVADGGTGLTAQPSIEASISGASMKGTVTAGAGDADRLPESRELATNDVNIDYIAFGN